MRDCCFAEAKASIHRHRDIATCDGCGALLLGYGEQTDYEKTIDQLTEDETPFETLERDHLWIVAKARTKPD